MSLRRSRADRVYRPYKRITDGRPYAYLVGPIPPRPDDDHGGHRVLTRVGDSDANDLDHLEAMAVAVFRTLRPDLPGDAPTSAIPPGFQIRVLRLPTRLYNAIADEANGDRGALERMGAGVEPASARYVLRLRDDRWQFSEWDTLTTFDLAGYRDAGIGPAGPAGPAPRFSDGQHRLN